MAHLVRSCTVVETDRGSVRAAHGGRRGREAEGPGWRGRGQRGSTTIAFQFAWMRHRADGEKKGIAMGICYQGFLVQLTATRIGNWKATVSPFRGECELAAANPEEGESVGEFLTREDAADAAKQYIHEKQLQGLGALLGRPAIPVMQNRGVPLGGATEASMTGIQERRCVRRLTVVTHIPARAHGTIPVRLVDISLGGVRIEHLSQLRPGFPCALELPPPAGPLSLATYVVRSGVVSNRRRPRGDRHFRYESGLAFAEVTPEQQAGLTRILESVSRSD